MLTPGQGQSSMCVEGLTCLWWSVFPLAYDQTKITWHHSYIQYIYKKQNKKTHIYISCKHQVPFCVGPSLSKEVFKTCVTASWQQEAVLRGILPDTEDHCMMYEWVEPRHENTLMKVEGDWLRKSTDAMFFKLTRTDALAYLKQKNATMTYYI